MITRTVSRAMLTDVNRPWRLGRVLSWFVFIIMLVAAGTPAAFAQAVAPVPIPPPPLSEEAIGRVLECRQLQDLLKQMASDDMDERERAMREARAIAMRERMRLLQQAIADSEVKGEIPGPPREEVDRRLQDLLKESCVYQILKGALKHSDGEVRARVQTLLDRLDPPSRRPTGQPADPQKDTPQRDAQSGSR